MSAQAPPANEAGWYRLPFSGLVRSDENVFLLAAAAVRISASVSSETFDGHERSFRVGCASRGRIVELVPSAAADERRLRRGDLVQEAQGATRLRSTRL